MTIRCLDAHGLPQPIYVVEIDGRCYLLDEVEQIIAACQSDSLANISVSPAHRVTRLFCEVPDCNLRTYRGRPYCPKHWQRYLRHGDATVALRPWDKKKEKQDDTQS